MNHSPVSKKALLLSLLTGIAIVIVQFLYGILDPRTTLVFCDVGQGDAAYIRIHNRIDLLIDAGPDRKVLDCLGRHMPFYDRTLELVIVSHPQKDHFGGLLFALDRYRVGKLLMAPLENPTQSFHLLQEKIAEKHISTGFPTAGTTIRLLEDRIAFLWPPDSEPQRLESADPNELSLVFLFQEDNFKALFTGDATPKILKAITTTSADILKVPHHGSKNGLTKKFLRLADPAVAVISVGKNNAYGHPSKEVLDMLKASGAKIRRTDVEGEIILKIP